MQGCRRGCGVEGLERANDCVLVIASAQSRWGASRRGRSSPTLVLRRAALGRLASKCAPTSATHIDQWLGAAQWLVVLTKVVVWREVTLQQQQFSPVHFNPPAPSPIGVWAGLARSSCAQSRGGVHRSPCSIPKLTQCVGPAVGLALGPVAGLVRTPHPP